MLQPLRSQLSSSVSSAAGPYGYTISLGGSTALASDQLGTPHLGSALLLMLGSVIAFVLLETGAQGSMVPEETGDDRPPSVLGNAHVPSAGAALCAVWGVLHVVSGPLAWAVTGFTATFLYFLITALQRITVEGFLRRGRQAPGRPAPVSGLPAPTPRRPRRASAAPRRRRGR